MSAEVALRHVTVFRQPGVYAGWPANYGMWSWGSEIALVFTAGVMDPDAGFHTRDRRRPFRTMQARSLDGGATWAVEPAVFPSPGGRALSADEHVDRELSLAWAIERGLGPLPSACPGDLDFTHPDLAMMCARTGLGAGTLSWFYLSTDRARTWHGPYRFPTFDLPGIDARTDPLIRGPRDCAFFLTADKPDGDEGAGVFAVRTRDGGQTFGDFTWVCHDEDVRSIMPATQMLPGGRVCTAVRRSARGRFDHTPHWIDLFASDDGGQSFRFLSRPAPDTGRGGNPPSLTLLPGGSLALVYGVRKPPFGVRARISADGGETWGAEITLRADGGCHDLGYPRTVVLPGGALVSAYYFNDDERSERYIAATIWQLSPVDNLSPNA